MKHLWKAGESGNPAGRPPGMGKVTQYRAMLQSHAAELIQIAVDQAKAGDSAALKLCIDRLLPPYRPEAMPVEFAMSQAGRLTKMGESILSAVSNGDLSPEQGAKLLQALAGQARLIEVEELEQRIKALEQSHVAS